MYLDSLKTSQNAVFEQKTAFFSAVFQISAKPSSTKHNTKQIKHQLNIACQLK